MDGFNPVSLHPNIYQNNKIMSTRINKKEPEGLKKFDLHKLSGAELRSVKGGYTVYYIDGVLHIIP